LAYVEKSNNFFIKVSQAKQGFYPIGGGWTLALFDSLDFLWVH
jgi:hypothetical protein